MGVEDFGEKPQTCPRLVREDIVRGIAAANGAAGAEQIDTACPPDCPRDSRSKVLGIPMPSFVGRCQIKGEEAPSKDPSDGHNLSMTGPFHPL